MSPIRWWLFGGTLAVYALVVWAVLASSWMVTLDWQVMLFRPYRQWPWIHAFLDYYVVLGQRGPTAVIVGAWLCWRAWRTKQVRPLLMFGVALLLLNVSVGAVKYGLGRLGPHYVQAVGSSELFSGGDIFPSGHTANAVVTWGVLAYLAARHRRTGAVITAFFGLTVGLTTIYLGTHWVSDVITGWTAGLLVLLVLPTFEPAVASAGAWLSRLFVRTSTAPKTSPIPAPAPPYPGGLVVARRASGSRIGEQRPVHHPGRHATRLPGNSRPATHSERPAHQSAPRGQARECAS